MTRDSFGAVLLIAILIGVVSGLINRAIRDWEYVNWAMWCVHMALWFGVWFPLFFGPYMKKRLAR